MAFDAALSTLRSRSDPAGATGFQIQPHCRSGALADLQLCQAVRLPSHVRGTNSKDPVLGFTITVTWL